MSSAKAQALGRSFAALCAAIAVGAPAAMADTLVPGRAQVVKAADAGFDRFTATTQYRSFITTKYWRMRAYSPYFDSRTSWYTGAWSYQNAYAIYTGSSVARDHPDWILKDAQGRRLYIPFDCANGTCPQYAGDFGNPEFRAWWIDQARSAMRKGYKGLFIDDVNMFLDAGDGGGNQVSPVDPRTGAAMGETAWKTYLASFLEQVRAALPTAEIVHNSLWFLGTSDPLIKRQIAAADLVEIERGVNDSGINGGDWTYGYDTLLSYVDALHRMGKGAIYDAWGPSMDDRAYNLASYFLTSDGRDGLQGSGSAPDDWWAGYDADLGAPRGERYRTNGIWRRDFANGSVVVNPPDAPQRTIDAGGATDVRTGAGVPSLTLDAAHGTILLSTSAGSPPPPAQEPPAPPAPGPTPDPASAAAVLAHANAAGGPAPPAQGSASSGAGRNATGVDAGGTSSIPKARKPTLDLLSSDLGAIHISTAIMATGTTTAVTGTAARFTGGRVRTR